jgi:hypothetical protein
MHTHARNTHADFTSKSKSEAHACTCIYIHRYAHACPGSEIQTALLYACMPHVCMHACLMYVCGMTTDTIPHLCLHTHTYGHIHTHTHFYMYNRIHKRKRSIQTHTCIHTYVNTYIYIHIIKIKSGQHSFTREINTCIYRKVHTHVYRGAKAVKISSYPRMGGTSSRQYREQRLRNSCR